jgi:hypothetical protein
VAMGALTEIGGTPLKHPPYSPDFAPCDFWAFPTMKREFRGQNRLFHYPPEACGKRSAARFREVGGALKEVHRLPKKRPSPHLHKVPTRSNKVSPRTLKTALVIFHDKGKIVPVLN